MIPAVDAASHTLDADHTHAAAADLLPRDDRQPLLVVVHSLHDTTDVAALDGGGDLAVALDAHEGETARDPVVCNVRHDEDEADSRDDVGDASVVVSRNGALDRREDGWKRC